MLTLTPPETETREGEDSQIDKTETEDTDRSVRGGWRERLGRFLGLFLVSTEDIEFDPDGRNAYGFNLIELVIGVVAIAALSVIGFGIYSNVTEDARATALNSNIQLAATNLDAAAALDPNIVDSTDPAALVQAMTERTSLSWNAVWESAEDEANVVRFEILEAGAPRIPVTGGTEPRVRWLVDDNSAVRLRMSNPQGEWRCALVIMKPSSSALDTLPGTGSAFDSFTTTNYYDDEDNRKQKAAELRGIWYDGGDVVTTNGLHDCSPVGSGAPDGITTTLFVDVSNDGDVALPEDSNTWAIGTSLADRAAHLDPSSTATASDRTLHSAVAQLDSNE